MTAKSLLRKLKELFGSSDRSESESGTRSATSADTDVTVEREPDQGAETTTQRESTETTTGEPVEKIKGIGPTYSDRLEAGGIETIPELADSEAETVADVAETSEGRASEWIKRAENW